jgi:hypothetical protein
MQLNSRFIARALVLVPTIALVVGGLAAPAPVQAAPKGWKLPDDAVEVGPDMYEVASKDVGGQKLTCVAMIHHGDKAKSNSGNHPGGSTSTCYSFLSSGMKWKTVKDYVVDPTVIHWDGATPSSSIPGIVANAVAQWEDAANGALGGGSINIMGNGYTGTISAAARAQIGVSMNNVNEVVFGPISDANVIAVTFVWGNYSGNPNMRQIVEWDQIYDDDGDWTWGDVTASNNLALMDFANIAQHEIGHAFGLGHPASTCTEETMYAYANFGETKKRTLNAGDILGISTLY